MRFLLKVAFWLGMVVLLLPMPDSEQGANGPGVSAGDAIAFLGTAVNDIKGFCARNPDSCVTGGVAVQKFGTKAQYGAKMLHEFINEKMQETADMPVPKAASPTLAAAARAKRGVDTLSPSDRAANWQAATPAQPQG